MTFEKHKVSTVMNCRRRVLLQYIWYIIYVQMQVTFENLPAQLQASLETNKNRLCLMAGILSQHFLHCIDLYNLHNFI